jgi:deoxyribodipyrimidine photolyase-related protein
VKLQIVFGNQLFPPEYLLKDVDVFMAESRDLCTYFRFHKHKIIFFLSAMREYRDELELYSGKKDANSKFKVHYHPLKSRQDLKYEEVLEKTVRERGVTELVVWEIEDKFMELRIQKFAKLHKLKLDVRSSPLFLTSRAQFQSYLRQTKKPFMRTFYEKQRRSLKILIAEDDTPVGGQFSFDEDNRKRLPKSIEVPMPEFPHPNRTVAEVADLVDREFQDHPGDSKGFWLPVRRENAEKWYKDFLKNRFRQFGAYEDALSREHDFVFHSAISPLLNVGLLHPQQVVKMAISAAKKFEVPLNSLEGFIRQVIGWREFVRGIYQEFSVRQESENFFGHKKKLAKSWYDGTTGIVPVDLAIKKTLKYGWCHHIERLMVISNCMLLCEVEPQEVHKWFMEMFVDSSDWVMGPNVYGMGQFSDGGLFATKPYICGSNYLLKMGDYEKGDWCAELDSLYWSFIHSNKEFYLRNPRTSMSARTWEKMSAEKRKMHLTLAQKTRLRLTVS